MVVCGKKLPLLSLLVFSLLLVGCGTATPEPRGQAPAASDAQVSPLVHVSVLPTPTAAPVHTPAALSAPADTPAPMPAQRASQLVVLHTNDNWGETEPCG